MPQPKNNKRSGIMIFALVALVFLGVCLIAYVITGDQGIEERFSKAVGLAGTPDSGDGGILGFALEGNQLSYLIILAVILLATAIIYVKYKV